MRPTAAAFAAPLPVLASNASARVCPQLRPTMVATGVGHELERRAVGSAGLILTEVALGTMTWGQQNSETDAHAQLDFAFERGVVGIDTAELYPVPPTRDLAGTTERYIASWIRARGGRAFRDKLVIASKVAGGSAQGRSFPWIRGADRKLDRANIVEAVDGILERLETDYIDLLQLHWPDRYVPMFGESAYDVASERSSVPIEEQLEVIDSLIKAGKVRNFGLSNESAWGIAQFDCIARARGYARPVSVQNPYNLIQRDFEGHPAEVCSPSNADVALLAYSPLAGGALTGKYLRDDVPPNVRFAMYPNYMKRFRSSLASAAIVDYERVADDAGISLTQLALAWCKSRWFMGSTIVGATSVAQLQENIEAFSVTLDQSVIDAVNKVYAKYRDPSKTS